jgi:peptidoglycan hydrolase FlgJ
MTNVSASSSLTTTKLNVAGASEREQLSAAAKQFEAVFVRQMLAAARKADFGGEDLFGGQALGTFREMQDNHFADVTAQTGTLGFAARIEAQLARFLPPSATASAEGTK